MALPATLNRSLEATASIATAELYNEGKSAANDPEQFPYARISEHLDGRTCNLCRHVDGKVLPVGSREYGEYRAPSHINCRRILAYIHKDETGRKDLLEYDPPGEELIRRHGHYHLDPKKHAALRIPAEPAGRNVVVRRVRNLETGRVETRLDWAPWFDKVSKAKRSLILKARVEQDPEKLAAIFEKLGLGDLSTPDQLRSAVLLGLKDRAEGWITESIKAPGADAQPDYLLLVSSLQKLSPAARRLWGDSRARQQAFEEIRAAHRAGDLNRLKAAVEAVDAAVVEGIDALGLPRGPVTNVRVEANLGANGYKNPLCQLRVALEYIERSLLQDQNPDSPFRTWVHESMHARQPFPPSAMHEYTPWTGYEEGMVEGLARLIVKKKAGMLPKLGAYSHYVRAQELLAAEVGIEPEKLWRRLWTFRTGTIRANFVDVIDGLSQEAGAEPLSGDQRRKLGSAADELFRGGQSFKDVDSGAIRNRWRQALTQ